MITYNTVNVPMPAIDQSAVTDWVQRVAASYDRRVGDINFIFVDDEEILRINREFIQHDYYTDHIGFDYCHGTTLAGDIFIGIETVASNAEQLGVEYMHELHRVIIHGVLHLVGIQDKTPEQRQEMEAAEDEALAPLYPPFRGRPKQTISPLKGESEGAG